MPIYQERLAKVRAAMEEAGVGLLFLHPSPYLFYATGIRQDGYFGIVKVRGDWLNGVFIGLEGAPVFVAPSMVQHSPEILSAAEGVGAEVRILAEGGDPQALLRSVMAGFPLRGQRLAVADRAWAALSEALRAARPDAALTLASPFMDPLLAVKDGTAMEAMRRSAALADQVYAAALPALRLGATARDLEIEVDHQFRLLGAEDNSFRTDVAFTRPGQPQPTPDWRLQPGDSVTFDFGGIYGGYASDFGRSAFAGEPTAEVRRAHETVLRAQAAAMAVLKPGEISGQQANAVARQVIEEAGWGPYFNHRLGHGIGITVHEPPFLSVGEHEPLQANMTFTVEPSIRIPGRFSNRVEDVVWVTEQGGVFLNAASHDLVVVER
ncbi:MAG: aminopeptidase P family protein [Chloroflexi bacterium]|nr:aminopeptidase P family protein [Chloroflexota bacterium]